MGRTAAALFATSAAILLVACQSGAQPSGLSGEMISNVIDRTDACYLFSESDVLVMSGGAPAVPTTVQREITGGDQCEWFVENGPALDSNMSVSYSCAPQASETLRAILEESGEPVEGTVSGARRLQPGSVAAEQIVLLVDECYIAAHGLQRVQNSGPQMLNLLYERLGAFTISDGPPQ